MFHVTAASLLRSLRSLRPHARAHGALLTSFLFLLLLFLSPAPRAYAQAPGTFSHVADYTHIGLILNSVVGPGPDRGTQRLYASILGTSKFHLLEIDPNAGTVTTFDSPLEGEIAAWGMTVGPDGNIYLGTAPNAHLMMFQVATGQIVDLGKASPTEQWIWSLTVGADNRVYGGTYPNCKLVRLDPLTGTIEDLGRMDPVQQYVRYVGASTSGVIYMGIGDAPGDIASYDIASGDIHELLPASLRQVGFAQVYLSTDGSFYGTLSPNAFRLASSDATMIPWDDRGTPISVTTLTDGRILSLEDDNETLVLTERSSSGSSTAISLAYSGEPTPLFRIGMGADGLVYGSASTPTDLVQIDPTTGLQNYIGTLGPGEAYSITAYGNQMLFGTYADDPSTLALYDPLQSFSTSPGSPNPSFLSIPNNNDSWRPLATTVAPDDTVYAGVEAGYGQPTGPLLIWNPGASSVAQYDVVPNQSVVSLAISDNLLIGGTTTQTGLGTTPTASDADLFVWDRLSNQVTTTVVPVPHAQSITDLVTGQDGFVLGIAANTVFAIDPNAGTVIRSQPFPALTLIYNSAGIDKANRLWGLSQEGVFVVDPASMQTELIAIPPVPITGGFILDDDLIYFLAGPSVYSYRLSGTLPATVTLTVSTNSLSYGSSLSLQASVQGISSVMPSGSLSILGDGQMLATVPLVNGAVQIELDTLAPGSHSLMAVYSGDSYYIRSQSSQLTVAIRSAALVAIIPSVYVTAAGNNVSFTSTVSSALKGMPVPTGTVQLYDNRAPLGGLVPLSGGTARFFTASLSAGYHTIAATYSGDLNYASASSAPLTEAVQGIALGSGVTLAEIPYSGSVRIQLTISPEGGLSGPVSLACSGVPENITCSFTAPTVTGGGYTQLVLTSNCMPPSAVAGAGTGAMMRLSWGGCGVLILALIAPLRVIRSAVLATVVMLGLASCGTSYIPLAGQTFTVHVTAKHICDATSNACIGVSSEIDIPARVDGPPS